MGRLGFGAGRYRSKARGRPETATPPIVLGTISPAAGWTGVAGSGFGAVPADPVRTTAKPACRLIVPPNQHFTDELLVGVYAGANDSGNLLTNMGLQKVVAHYEGTSVDIAAPSYQTFDDANGNPVTYFGWWITLKRDGRSGSARLYFEAMPRDPTMQNRVIGPYLFLPSATAHDYSVTVAPSQAAIAGTRYQTLKAAFDYMKGVAAKRPLITIVEAGNYELNGPTGGWNKADGGRITVTATAAARIIRPLALSVPYFRPSIEPMCWRGSNIRIDFSDANEYYTEQTYTWKDTHWFDGCRLTQDSGASTLYKKRTKNQQLVRGSQWHTEVAFSDLYDHCRYSHLSRGITATRGYNDIFNMANCVIGTRVEDHDSAWFRTPVAAMTISYAGTGATATIEGTGSRTFTARVNGASVGTYTVNSTDASHDANTNYHVSNVVDWINALGAGWSAALVDNTRQGAVLYPGTGLPGGAFAATSVKPGPLTLYTAFDLHADWWQRLDTGAMIENIVIADNAAFNSIFQSLLLGGTTGMSDTLILNNAWHQDPGGLEYGVVTSQLGRTHSHVVIAHNSWVGQSLYLRMDGAYNPDAYALTAANTARSLQWIGSGSDGDLRIRDNHLQAGAAVPANATGTTIGGTDASLFPGAAAGSFAPQGDLLANLKPPVVRFDGAGTRRGSTAAAGAVA